MKYTKKMLMIPEMEYQTLMNMLKNKDELGYEKSKLDTKITKTLKDPKLNELIKAKKYDLLLKQQQQARKQISDEANKPKKVMIDRDQIQSMISEISRYLGVAPRIEKSDSESDYSTASESLPPSPRKHRQRKKKTNITPMSKEQKTEQLATDQKPKEEEDKSTTTKQSPIKESPAKKDYLFHPNYYGDIDKIIRQNKKKLKILPSAKIQDDNGRVIEGSDYEQTLNYLTGKSKIRPPGTDELIDRMKGERYYRDAIDWADWHRQRGEGKRTQLYKTTKGLVRRKQNIQFKPQLWAKL